MKKFFLGFVIGIVFVGLIGVILVFAAIRMASTFGGERPVTVSDNSALVLNLEGAVPEQAPVDVAIPFLQQQTPLTVLDTWKLLHRAAGDTRVKALVLEPRGLDAGWAKLEELRAEILSFKQSGKPVYAYLRNATMREYYLATAADKIYMAPEDELDVKGLRAELMYFKGTLDKVGVTLEFEHVGKYKDAPDQFTKTSASPETLEVTNEILDQYYGNMVQVISEGRKLPAGAVRGVIDQGPFIGKSALDSGLVDALIFEDEMLAQLNTNLKATLTKIGARSYSKAAGAEPSGRPRIAYVTGDGEITRGDPGEDVSDSGITAFSMVKQLRQVADDSSIKGAIVRVDSPGGDGIASDDILHEMKLLSKKKPVLISMSDLAASGGYFIAMTGDPVLAYSNTLTGSIGVFFGKVNLSGLYDKLGIKTQLLTRGRFADIDSETKPLTQEEKDKVQKEIQVFYRGFVERVAEARKRPYDQVEPLAQGRVWLGAQAKMNGLVDEIGGLDRAVEMIKQRTNIPASEQVTLVTYPPRRTLLELLLKSSTDNNSELESAIRAVAGQLPWKSLAHGGVQRLMPYSLVVK
ncbi:MAG TPA: signal peptide peptidase SppA [Bryobacteraceae bacterium]|jgi:protease-4|nr:signal peptide peptidase SppA [Bryobacteraceae bacterium]